MAQKHPVPLRIGIIGFGAIGQALFQAIEQGRAGSAVCPAILIRRPRPSTGNRQTLFTRDCEAFLRERLDAVVECAGQEALRRLGEPIVTASDLLATSVGAFADDELLARLRSAARASGHRLWIPAAGIGALDILGGAAAGRLDEVRVTVRKNPDAWFGTPAEHAHDLHRLAGETTLYEGPVREGARLYPANVNISAAVALAGIGWDRTALKIVADPAIRTHVVEVEASGEFGRFRFVEDVIPSADNPKTGRLVALALVKTLRQMTGEFVVGC